MIFNNYSSTNLHEYRGCLLVKNSFINISEVNRQYLHSLGTRSEDNFEKVSSTTTHPPALMTHNVHQCHIALLLVTRRSVWCVIICFFGSAGHGRAQEAEFVKCDSSVTAAAAAVAATVSIQPWFLHSPSHASMPGPHMHSTQPKHASAYPSMLMLLSHIIMGFRKSWTPTWQVSRNISPVRSLVHVTFILLLKLHPL